MIDGKITNFLEIIVSVEYFGKSGGGGVGGYVFHTSGACVYGTEPYFM